MGDPLSVTASVVGIVVPALHGTRLLLDDLRELKEAPKTVKRLTDEVDSVHTVLGLLQGVKDEDWQSLGLGVAGETKGTIDSCTQACDLFRVDLKKWTEHSKDGKLALRDRANVGFFKKSQVKTMSTELTNCKLAIDLIVDVATLYSSVRHTHMTEDIKKAIITRQDEVQGAMTTVDRQLVVVEQKVEDMSLSDDDDENEDEAKAAEERAAALRQLEEERKSLNVLRKLYDELLAKAQEDAVAEAAKHQSISTTITFSGANSGVQVGTNNGTMSGFTFGRN